VALYWLCVVLRTGWLHKASNVGSTNHRSCFPQIVLSTNHFAQNVSSFMYHSVGQYFSTLFYVMYINVMKYHPTPTERYITTVHILGDCGQICGCKRTLKWNDIFRFLVWTGANIEQGSSTPLMEAAQEGHVDLVKFLLERGWWHFFF
jgi:ankyrin repeat domain-containing protein 17